MPLFQLPEITYVALFCDTRSLSGRAIGASISIDIFYLSIYFAVFHVKKCWMDAAISDLRNPKLDVCPPSCANLAAGMQGCALIFLVRRCAFEISNSTEGPRRTE